MSVEPVFVSIIIYAYNAERTIRDCLTRIDRAMAERFSQYEMIMVNDFSVDGTLDEAHACVNELTGSLTIINLSRKHGIERAMMAGLNKSMGDFVYEIESAVIDYPPEILGSLYEKASKGYDIVAAGPDKTAFLTRVFYFAVNKLSYLDLEISTENIRLVSRRALNAMLNLKEKVRYRKALYAFTGFSSTKVRYEPASSKYPSKKINHENLSLAIDVIVSFSNFGLRLAHYISLFFFLCSVFMGIYALYNYFFNKNTVQGWTTLMILMSVGFSGMFFILGIIGEYITRIQIEIQSRPIYNTQSVEFYKEKRNPQSFVNQEVAAASEES